MFVSTLCFADIDTTGLTKSQKAELAVQAAKLAENNEAPKIPTPPVVEQVDKWVAIGANVGKGLAGAAKELGVAANEFVQTPVGKITAGLIIWKVAGNDIMYLGKHFVLAPMIFIIALSFWTWFFRRTCLDITVTQTVATDGKLGKKIKEVSRRSSDFIAIIVVGYVVIFGASAIIIFSS